MTEFPRSPKIGTPFVYGLPILIYLSSCYCFAHLTRLDSKWENQIKVGDFKSTKRVAQLKLQMDPTISLNCSVGF